MADNILPLYQPHNFHTDIFNQHAIHSEGEELVHFPLPASLGERSVGRLALSPNEVPSLCISSIFRLPCSTGESRTKIAPMVANLPTEKQLHKLRKCEVLWDNLAGYAIRGNNNQRWTFTENTSIASKKDQAKAAFALHGYYESAQQNVSEGATSENDIVRILIDQLVKMADLALKVSEHSFPIKVCSQRISLIILRTLLLVSLPEYGTWYD